MTNYVETARVETGTVVEVWGPEAPGMPSRDSFDGSGEFELHGPPLVIRHRIKGASAWSVCSSRSFVKYTRARRILNFEVVRYR